jgi:hypothetical protein
MTQTPSGTRPPQEPPYEHSGKQSQKFLDALAGVPWQAYPAYNVIVLEADCPECHHKNAINKVVPTVGTLPFLTMYADARQSRAYVQCACTENHGAPPGEKGCGRWAMIAPHLTGVALDNASLDEVLAAGESALAEPAAAERVPEEDDGEKLAAEKGNGDDDSH